MEVTWTRRKIQVSYYSIRKPFMKCQTLACIVHKTGQASDFIQRGLTPEREITQTRKKYGSNIFP